MNQIIGRISEIQKNSLYIRKDGEDILARCKGNYINNGIGELPVVGDYVKYVYNPSGESLVYSIEERKNVLKRPDQSGHAIGFVKTMLEQDMVANVDYLFIVTSLNHDYSVNRVARYVSMALSGDIVPVVILTKADLCDDIDSYVDDIRKLSDKVRVHPISAVTGYGMEALMQYMIPGITVALIGSSGVGKSTLVNALAGEELMKTSAVRESDSKGRHTTTYRHLFELKNGVVIIDTPGMREIGLIDVGEGLEDTFEDVKNLECQCRFSDCRHKSEPGCAIKMAIMNGTLTQKRYELYESLSQENNFVSGKKAQYVKRKSR